MRESAAGRIVGTPAYMSPEQAKGRPVDRRTDIWAFGVVLVEMLTGRRLFGGGTPPEVLAAVITSQPELGLLPAATPASILTLISRCLDRNAQLRLRDIGEARVALEKHLADPDADRPTAAAILPASRTRSAWFWAAGALGAATLVFGALLWRGDRIPGRPLM